MEIMTKFASEVDQHVTFSTVASKYYQPESPTDRIQLRNRGICLTAAAIAAAETIAFLALTILTAPIYFFETDPNRKGWMGSLVRIADASPDKLLINAFATALLLIGAVWHPEKMKELSPKWMEELNRMLLKPVQPFLVPKEAEPTPPPETPGQTPGAVTDITFQYMTVLQQDQVKHQTPPDTAQANDDGELSPFIEQPPPKNPMVLSMAELYVLRFGK